MDKNVITVNFWNLYSDLTFKQEYCRLYLSKINNRLQVTRWISGIISAMAIAGLTGENWLQEYWAYVVLVSQIFIIYMNLSDLTKKKCTLILFSDKLQKLLTDMEKDWVTIQSGILFEETTIVDKADSYRKEIDDISSFYLSNLDLKDDFTLINKANTTTDTILKNKHIGGDNNV